MPSSFNGMPPCHDNSLDHFFILTQKAIEQYCQVGEGVLTLDCEKRRTGSEPVFKLTLHGSLDSPFHFTLGQLSHYVMDRTPRNSNESQSIFQYVEKYVLEVLQTVGYGSVVLTLKRDRKGMAVTVKQTFSHRYIFSQEPTHFL